MTENGKRFIYLDDEKRERFGRVGRRFEWSPRYKSFFFFSSPLSVTSDKQHRIGCTMTIFTSIAHVDVKVVGCSWHCTEHDTIHTRCTVISHWRYTAGTLASSPQFRENPLLLAKPTCFCSSNILRNIISCQRVSVIVLSHSAKFNRIRAQSRSARYNTKRKRGLVSKVSKVRPAVIRDGFPAKTTAVSNHAAALLTPSFFVLIETYVIIEHHNIYTADKTRARNIKLVIITIDNIIYILLSLRSQIRQLNRGEIAYGRQRVDGMFFFLLSVGGGSRTAIF